MNSISDFRDIAIRLVSFAATPLLFIYPNAASAQIYNWQTEQVIPGTQNITPGPAINLSSWDTAGHELEYAELGSLNLAGAAFSQSDLTSADFSGSNLTNAGFFLSNLTNANFSGATITGADFYKANFTNGNAFTSAQLYSTASYQAGNLSGIDFDFLVASGWSLANENLTNSKFEQADLTGVNLRDDNLTGVDFFLTGLTGVDFTGATITNADFNSSGGFTPNQLYSTASYQNGNLTGITLWPETLVGWNLSHQNLTGAVLKAPYLGADLSFSNLTNATLLCTDFSGANFTGATINGASITGNLNLNQLYSTTNYQSGNLSGVTIMSAELAGGNFAGMNLSKANFGSTDLTGANFTGANLSGAVLGATNANFTNANLTGANIDGAGANFTDSNLTNAILGGDFTNANLTGATITGAQLSIGNPFTESQFDSTASFQDGNLNGISCEYGSFAGWNLSGKNLTGAYFYSTVLDHINLSNANLTGLGVGKYTSFVGANFSGANLTGALFGINAFEAGFPNLSNADFVNANLANTRFGSCILSNADFRGATFSDTGFGECNLYRANFSGDYFDTGTLFGGAPGFDGAETSINEANFSGAHVYLPSFASVNPTNVNFAGAFFSGSGSSGYYFFADDDLRGATGWPSTGITLRNSILPNGTIPSLALVAKELLVIRNNPMAIHVSPTATFNATSTLQFWLEGNWTSPMIFDLGVVPSLAGTLDLEFSPGVDPSTLVGQTFELFDFIDPLGSWDTFNSITTAPGVAWDTSQLYTNGIVTLLAVPEPAIGGLVAAGMIAMLRRRK